MERMTKMLQKPLLQHHLVDMMQQLLQDTLQVADKIILLLMNKIIVNVL